MPNIKPLLVFFIILILISCSDSEQDEAKNNNLDTIKLVIESDEMFKKIKNPYEKPGNGKVFRAFLISITNASKYSLDGGSSDYHCTFSVITSDGFVIQAINTASEAWRENRLVWNADEIPIGKTRKGWVVFSVPANSNLITLSFDVNERITPHEFTGLGTIEVPIN